MRRKSPGFSGYWHKADESGELVPTRERIDFSEWKEIVRLFWLGVEMGLQSDPERPTKEVS